MEQTDRETLRPRAAKKEQKHSERRQLGVWDKCIQLSKADPDKAWAG